MRRNGLRAKLTAPPSVAFHVRVRNGFSETLAALRTALRAPSRARSRKPFCTFSIAGLHPILLASLAGIALRVSLPPTNLAGGVVAGLAMALICVHRQGFAMHIAIGFCVGLTWHIFVAVSVLEWGLLIPAVASITPALIVAFAFGSHCALENVTTRKYSHFNFALSWIVAISIGDIIGAPVAFSASLLDTPFATPLISTLGASGTDALIAIFATSIAMYFVNGSEGRSSHLAFVLIIMITIIVISSHETVATQTATPSESATWVHAIDPSISSASHRRARYSLTERNRIERHIDELTKEALSLQDGIVVLPEGSNGLFNLRVPRRRNAIGDLIGQSRSHLLYPSHDLDEDGTHYNSIVHISDNGVQAIAHKSRTVPIAERHIRAGEPQVISIGAKKLGLAICYDSVFRSHISALHKANADTIVAVANDASFGGTWLAEIHLLYTRLRALESQTSLIFLSNGGPVAAFDMYGSSITPVRSANGRIYSYALRDLDDSAAARKLMARSFIHGFILLFFISLLFGAIKQNNRLY